MHRPCWLEGPGWTSTGPGAHREKRRADNRPGEGASRGEKRKRTAQGTTHAANDDSEIRHEAGPPCRQATDKTPIAPSLSRRALSAAVPARLFCFLAGQRGGGGGREHERVRVFAIRQPAAREHTQDGQQAVAQHPPACSMAWSLHSHQRSRSLPDSSSGAHAPPPLSSHRPPTRVSEISLGLLNLTWTSMRLWLLAAPRFSPSHKITAPQ